MSKIERSSLPFTDWPDQDRRLWQSATEEGRYFQKAGKASHWSEATKLQVQKGYAKWLWYLQSSGLLDPAVFPSERISEDHLRGYLAELDRQGLASVTINSRITDLTEAIRVMEPRADLTLLRDLCARLNARAVPSRKKAERLRAPSEIWEAAAAQMWSIRSEGTLTTQSASRFRDAMSVAFLIWSPIRLSNLQSLALGETITFAGDLWRCSFAAHQMKDKTPLDFYLPQDEEYRALMQLYLRRYRQKLLRQPELPIDAPLPSGGPLWVSTRAEAMSDQSLYYGCKRCTKATLGTAINPHLFRDCAASALTADKPEYVLAAARILNHNQLSTTLTHYEHASMIQAASRLHDVIGQIIDEAGEGDPGRLDDWFDRWGA
ncbi:tyrosine-type recombinase/integrase [Rhodobacterales bacterium FZCC0069]|nr:tyrosine-type recombinase/integrase [Rhodobacterales bacterium FZCC0069]